MATDSFVEDTLVAAFKTLSLIKSKTVSGKTVYNYSDINKTFDKSNWLEEGWYELDMMPGEPMQAELGTAGRNRWVGIFQVTICVKLNVGKTMANARYDALASLFKRGTVFSGITIDKCHRCPNLSSDMEGAESDHYRLPVRIAYRADLAN
jgi:hypothetical protein